MANPITATTTTRDSESTADGSPDAETAAQLLERERDPLIHDWFALVQKQEDLTAIPMSYADCTAHLPRLLAGCDCTAAPEVLDQSCYVHRCR